MAGTAPQPLDYAPPGRLSLRRWAKRLFLLGWVVFTLYLAYDKWGGWAKLQVAVLRSQSRCLRFTQPADRVVFDNDSARVSMVLQGRGYRPLQDMPTFDLPDSQLGPPDGAVSILADQPFSEFTDARARLDRWEQLRRPGSVPSGGGGRYGLFGSAPSDSFVVGLHRRQAPGRDERLVVIHADWYGYKGDALMLTATTTAPAGLTRRAEDVTPAGWRFAAGGSATLNPAADGSFLRLYSGGPDPSDPARYTLSYETGAGGGSIEAVLQPDDRVVFRILSGPALDPPANLTPPQTPSVDQ